MSVQPIREKEKISEIKKYLHKTNSRDYLLFTIGINVGLRISDLLKLQVKDVRNKTHVSIVEEKTTKPKRFLINNQLKTDITEYIKGKDDEEYLFASRQKCKDGELRHITRYQAYKIMKYIGKKFALNDLGTHTFRKTYGYWQYQKNGDIAKLQAIFNHRDSSSTLRYIGITDDELDKFNEDFYL